MVHSAISYRLPVFFFCFSLIFSIRSKAQNEDTDRLTPQFHKERRAALRHLLPDHSVAIVFSNPERTRSNDVLYQFSQNPDFYYLTGFREPRACVLIFSDSLSDMLFIQGFDSAQAVWTGRTMTEPEASKATGISTVYTLSELEKKLPGLCNYQHVLIQYPSAPENDADDAYDLSDAVNIVRGNLNGCSPDSTALKKLMAGLREIKTTEEIVLMQHAIDLSVDAFKLMIRNIQPGYYEYQAQADFEYFSRHKGSEYTGYPTIAGSGPNTCVLHYISNRKQMVPGELFLADMGAEYHGYTADITRTIPVNGRFTPEQLSIYNLVLKAQDAAFEVCKPGSPFRATNEKAVKIIAEGLMALGIISETTEYKRYFMHGTSHYLGLDVHDAGLYKSLQEGNVITVEPGIYIPAGSPCDRKWWNTGVRIEDDVLITADGHRILSSGLSRLAADIQKLMADER